MSKLLPHIVTATSGLRTVIAHDVDEHAHNLTNWEQRYDQVAAGSFDGELKEWRADGLQIFRERSSHAVRQSCSVWPDAYWFGIEAHASGMRINGRQIGANAVMTRPGNREFELMTPDHHEILGIVIQRNTLLEAADRHGCTIGWSGLAETELLQVSADALQACVSHITALLDEDNSADMTTDSIDIMPTQMLAQASPERCQEQVIAALLSMLDHSSVDQQACSSFVRRRRIVNDARNYAMHNQAQAITVPMLCAHLHVSRRTLQYCFEDVLGISPMTYLRSLRLNGVRRQLRESTSPGQRIGDVAAAWGFTNFSQFSCDYKKLFGATPSASAALRSTC